MGAGSALSVLAGALSDRTGEASAAFLWPGFIVSTFVFGIHDRNFMRGSVVFSSVIWAVVFYLILPDPGAPPKGGSRSD
jgi:hypothetical protein